MLKYVAGVIGWSIACLYWWVSVIFWGFPKTTEDLLNMGYTEWDFMVQEFWLISIPIIWIAVPILFFVIRYVREKKDNY